MPKAVCLILRKELVCETQQTLAGYSEMQNISLKPSGFLVMEIGDFRTDIPDAGAFRRRPNHFQIPLKVCPVQMPLQ